MKPLILFILLLCARTLVAQEVYTIKADSTKLTGCDSNELIIENHTRGVPGFLYNVGNGRTAFKRPVTKLDDTTYLVGSDTIHLRFPTAWVLGEMFLDLSANSGQMPAATGSASRSSIPPMHLRRGMFAMPRAMC